MPGPAHLLKMKDEVLLSADQVTAVAAIFERMRAKAIAGGNAWSPPNGRLRRHSSAER